jgi:AraC-like DNA-binding protein
MRGPGMLLVSFIDDSRVRDRIARQLAGHVRIHFCDTRPDVLKVLDRVDAEAFICLVQDRRGQPMAPLIRTVRQRHSMLPVVGIVRTNLGADIREIVPAVRAGLNDVMIDWESAWDVIRKVVRRGQLDCTTMTLIRAASRCVPHGARLLVEQYFWSVGPRSNVQQVATAFGISRRTLVREHERYSLPQPSKLVTWSRVLAAGCLISSARSASLDQIARIVGFSSSSALRRATRDCADDLPSDLRATQSFDSLLKRFGASLKPSVARSTSSWRQSSRFADSKRAPPHDRAQSAKRAG